MGILDRIVEGRITQRLEPLIQALEADRQQVKLKLEELDYERVEGKAQDYSAGLPDLHTQRQSMCLIARLDPFAQRAHHISTQFTFGAGLGKPVVREADEAQNKAKERLNKGGATPNECKGQQVINALWDKNRDSLFGRAAQYQRQFDLLFVGDIFLHCGDQEGIYRVHPLNWQEIVEIISDPDDYLAEVAYKRVWTPQRFDRTDGNWKPLKAQTKYYPALGVEGDGDMEPGAIFHIAVNRFAQERFGRPMYESLKGWFRRRKEVAEDTATLFASLASLAWKEKILGGRRAMDAAKTKVDTAEANTFRVPPGAGSVRVETEGRELEAMQKPKIGGDAWDTARLMMNAIASGTDLSEHYFGNAGDSNLATATALEYPILMAFQWWRGLWTEWYDTLFDAQLELAGLDGLTVDIDFPPLGARNVAEYVKAVIDAEAAGMIPKEEGAQAVMQALTLEDVDYAMKLLRQRWEEEEQGLNAPLPVGTPQQPPPEAPPK